MEQQDRNRLFVLAVLVPVAFSTFFFIFSSFVPFFFMGFALIGLTTFFYLFVVPRILQERGAAAGYYNYEGSSFYRYLAVLLVAFVVYWLFNIFADAETAMGLTIFTIGVLYSVLWYHAGKDMRDHLAQKRLKDQEFIDSLGVNEGKCQSCMKPLDPDAEFCSNCGFKRKEIMKDTGYIR